MITKRKLPLLALVAIAGVLLAASGRLWHQNKDLELVGQAERLNTAIWAGDVSKITALIAEDRTILRAEGIKSTTPLNCAVRAGRREITDLLVTNGADINLPDGLGITPLHCGAGRGDKPMVEFLLAKGAKVNAKASGGVTPLHMAVNSRQRDVVDLLVVRGADLTAKSITPEFAGPNLDDLYTPLQWAVKIGQNDVADFLRTHGAKE
jgi:uncharacterized protein